jgi:NAD(P)-dependent dehydrogenase (short-subunit alcohol dehydrogenase family)
MSYETISIVRGRQAVTVLPLAGKVAIVTGAGRGLGRSMARGLARAGAKIVLTAARTHDELDAAAAEIAAKASRLQSRRS